ncbi:unknown [Streptococcus phage M102AD]|uniref:hypothetical protein n=1 Tax=Streptococcus phage M102AD TaxID=1587907 RepID=UPI00022FA23E|nr:hypothetical protein AVU37_gp31 [Streptococcus phage M102AD]ABD48934.1 unknown [Streptococcus phage M102AD]
MMGLLGLLVSNGTRKASRRTASALEDRNRFMRENAKRQEQLALAQMDNVQRKRLELFEELDKAENRVIFRSAIVFYWMFFGIVTVFTYGAPLIFFKWTCKKWPRAINVWVRLKKAEKEELISDIKNELESLG